LAVDVEPWLSAKGKKGKAKGKKAKKKKGKKKILI
jgi:hypothetical protein